MAMRRDAADSAKSIAKRALADAGNAAKVRDTKGLSDVGAGDGLDAIDNLAVIRVRSLHETPVFRAHRSAFRD